LAAERSGIQIDLLNKLVGTFYAYQEPEKGWHIVIGSDLSVTTTRKLNYEGKALSVEFSKTLQADEDGSPMVKGKVRATWGKENGLNKFTCDYPVLLTFAEYKNPYAPSFDVTWKFPAKLPIPTIQGKCPKVTEGQMTTQVIRYSKIK